MGYPAARKTIDGVWAVFPIIEGSPNVFINNYPAARRGDLSICPPPFPPMPIVVGSPTVFTNSIPQARCPVDYATLSPFILMNGSPNVFVD